MVEEEIDINTVDMEPTELQQLSNILLASWT